jgi:hypothetical protein
MERVYCFSCAAALVKLPREGKKNGGASRVTPAINDTRIVGIAVAL